MDGMKLRRYCQQGTFKSALGGSHIPKRTYIILGQEIERTENFIVVKLEALGSLQDAHIIRVCRDFQDLFRAPLRLELSLRILGRNSRASATPGVVAVRVMRRRRSRVLRYRVVICSHFVCGGMLLRTANLEKADLYVVVVVNGL